MLFRSYDFANYFNYEAYLYLQDLNKEDYIVEENISVVDGTDTYAVTGTIENIQIDGTGVFVTDAYNTLPYTQYRSSINGFFIKNNSIVYTPTPTSDRTDVVRYIPEIDQIIALTDDMIIDIKHLEYIKDSVKIAFYEWSSDNKEVGSRERIQDSFKRFLKQAKKAPKVHIW